MVRRGENLAAPVEEVSEARRAERPGPDKVGALGLTTSQHTFRATVSK